jgi:phosphatidylinositol glycan class V
MGLGLHKVPWLLVKRFVWCFLVTNVSRLKSPSALSSASSSPLYAQAYAGILLSHVAHLLSVLILYALVRQMPMTQEKQRAKVAFIAASMHIFSSAGLFLSAPYSESLFSMLNFLGMFMHTCIPWNLPLESYGPLSLLHILLSGACFALATTVRSNGIFSGILYFHYVYMLFQSRINLRTLLTVVVVGLSAAMILSAMLFPQYMAYQDYCIVPLEGATRPWCSRSLPSIYSWVQEHYWYVCPGRWSYLISVTNTASGTLVSSDTGPCRISLSSCWPYQCYRYSS